MENSPYSSIIMNAHIVEQSCIKNSYSPWNLLWPAFKAIGLTCRVRCNYYRAQLSFIEDSTLRIRYLSMIVYTQA